MKPRKKSTFASNLVSFRTVIRLQATILGAFESAADPRHSQEAIPENSCSDFPTSVHSDRPQPSPLSLTPNHLRPQPKREPDALSTSSQALSAKNTFVENTIQSKPNHKTPPTSPAAHPPPPHTLPTMARATHCPSADRTRGRRARREANDLLLSASGGAPSAADLTELFSYTSPSFWDSWQTFASLPERAQSPAPAPAPRADPRDPLRRVDARLRPLLAQGFVEPLVRRIERDVRALGEGADGEITLMLESARDRAVAHGVASYYEMTHYSTDTPPPESARVTVIRKEGKGSRVAQRVPLVDLVFDGGKDALS